MVLGSAQYKRQHDYEAADSPAGGGGGIIIGGNDDDARIVHSERELFMANQVGQRTFDFLEVPVFERSESDNKKGGKQISS